MSADLDTPDTAIRALVRSVALAAYEHAAELAREQPMTSARMVGVELWEMRGRLADELTEITMETADEDPESEVHAVRALAHPPHEQQPPEAP